MTYEEKIAGLESLLRGATEVLSPLQVARWTHQSKKHSWFPAKFFFPRSVLIESNIIKQGE